MMKKMNSFGTVAMVLVIVGGLNWGLVGAFDFNLVASIFGEASTVSKIIYILVGLSALYLMVGASRMMGGKNMTNQPNGM